MFEQGLSIGFKNWCARMPDTHLLSCVHSICRRLTVSERRFKVAASSGKFSIVLDVLPYYVVSPSEAGAEISAAQVLTKSAPCALVSAKDGLLDWYALLTLTSYGSWGER